MNKLNVSWFFLVNCYLFKLFVICVTFYWTSGTKQLIKITVKKIIFIILQSDLKASNYKEGRRKKKEEEIAGTNCCLIMN